MVEDRLDHRFGLHQYVVIPEPQNGDVFGLEKTSAYRINIRIVLRAIKFNDQLQGLAIEVDDVGCYWVLTTEFQAI